MGGRGSAASGRIGGGGSFLNPGEVDALASKLQNRFEGWGASLSKPEKDAIYWYTTGEGSREMNHLLRQGDYSSRVKFSWERELIDNSISNINSSLDKARLPNDMVLHRGVREAVLHQIFPKLEVGAVGVEQAFSSITIDKHIARTFAKKEGTVVNISLPKGSKAGWVNAAMPFSSIENEFLLKSGSKFKIRDIRPGEIDVDLIE